MALFRAAISGRILKSSTVVGARSMSSWWRSVEPAPKDPILRVTEAFLADPSPDKVSVGVGAYRDDNGKPMVLKCVREAERRIAGGFNMEYLPMGGSVNMNEESLKLAYGEIGFDTYFSMARGNAIVPAMEMTKWFDTNYHFIVLELGPDVKFSYVSDKAVNEYKEAMALGVDNVLIGPVSYLLLSKPTKGVEKSFALLSLLDKILPIYKEVITELKGAGASWIQFDEPNLVMDLDLVRGSQTLDLIKGGFPSGKYLFAGVVDGRTLLHHAILCGNTGVVKIQKQKPVRQVL
ncbi:PREDICTED: 5-methyltetrahydropteroyltriglutamate--homocysteine methyltransferase-like [Ipomoea nil]|uniref:5-methyltetrahydropteroyltriglutamate-- homocysteine methyltransferase-like n=1 Tax=Ipomoea nil TaxID=35883 RepID=UPI00090144F3|nr:PREDICTED: 5-methyltetrahydropteroyltriglutamate--homocysteine methyltransferase-like [Ipomoea nil]